MTDRVDAESGVLVREDADEAAPDECLAARRPAHPADEVADQERQTERDHDPEQIEAVDPADQTVLVEIATVLPAALHSLEGEEPADVSVGEPLDRGRRALVVAGVRRVGVAVLVRQRVVLPMVRHPLRHRPLHRERAEDRERAA